MEKLRIFVSGTNDDMAAERAAVGRAVDSVKIAEGIHAEQQVSWDQSPKDWILEQIRVCTVYIGVFSHRYGFICDEDVSATEFEFNEARKLQKPILIFIRKLRDEEKKLPDFRLQERFLKRVSDFSRGYMRKEFDNVGELESLVADHLPEVLIKIIRQAADQAGSVPNPDLADAYLQELPPYLDELARQKTFADWSDEMYIERKVAQMQGGLRGQPAAARLSEYELLEKVLTREQRVILLGAPGMGKTTSLLHLGRTTASQHPPSGDAEATAAEVPIYVELKYYDGEPELETLLARRVNEVLLPRPLRLAPGLAESTNILKTWLTQSTARFLLLFDGLNEVQPKYHTKVRGLLQTFMNSPHRIVITCREGDYDQSLNGRATQLDLAPLGLNDIYDYLCRILGDRGKRFFDEQQILHSEKMETLASNPLTLWLIGLVAAGTPEDNLPTNRGRLIERFVALMPKLRSREGVQRHVSLDIVTALLAKVAFEMQGLSRLTADLGELRRWQLPTAGRRLEDALIQAKEWRFLKADGGMGEPVEFLHQLFLEYFAAAFLDSELRTGRSFEEAIGERLFSEHWIEVIMMLAGITDRPSQLVQWFSQRIRDENDWRRALLVKRCWETTAAIDDAEATTAVVDALLVALANGIQDEKGIRHSGIDPHVRRKAVQALASMGAPAVEKLIAALKKGLGVGEGAAVALGKIGDPRAVEPLIAALGDEKRNGLHESAAVALGDIGDPRAVEPLFAALSSEIEEVGWSAARALGKIGDRKVVEPLIELLEGRGQEFSWLNDADPDQVDLEELWANAPLAARMIGNPLALGSVELKELAAVALGMIGDEQAVKPLTAALKHEGPDVRWCAAEALGNIGSQQALPELKRAVREDDGDSVWGAVTEAAQQAIQKLKKVRTRKKRRG